MLFRSIEELRLLSNMQVDDVKLVQVLLFGQPELDRMLNSAELRQVKDRVVFQIHIEPFSRDELADYLAFRLQQAGFQGQCFFNDAVIDAIYRKTQGYARAVNRLADQALMAAFAEQTHQVLLDHVESSNQEAIQPLAQEAPASSMTTASEVSRKKTSWQLVFIVIALLAVVGWFALEISQSYQHSLLPTQQTTTEANQIVVKPDVELTASVDKGDDVKLPTVQQELLVSDLKQQVAPRQSLFVAESPLHQDSLVLADSSLEPLLKAGQTDKEWRLIHQKQLIIFEQFAAEDKYTIQLMSSPWRLRQSFVQEALEMVSLLPKAPAFYYDYSAAPERPRIAAIYGVYDSKDTAKQVLQSLTAMNKGYRPEMMSFKKVVALMQASQVLVGSP